MWFFRTCYPLTTFLEGDSKSRLDKATETYLNNAIGTQDLRKHLDQLPEKDAKNSCKNTKDRYWGDWRFVYSTNGRDPEFRLLSENQSMKVSNLAFDDVISEEKFCIDHRNFGLAVKSCK